MIQELIDAIAEMRDDEAVPLAERMLDEGVAPLEILAACREAMGIVGKLFEDGEYFVPELILAGEMLREISEIVKPRLSEEGDIE